jgi:hypothetical protein
VAELLAWAEWIINSHKPFIKKLLRTNAGAFFVRKSLNGIAGRKLRSSGQEGAEKITGNFEAFPRKD